MKSASHQKLSWQFGTRDISLASSITWDSNKSGHLVDLWRPLMDGESHHKRDMAITRSDLDAGSGTLVCEETNAERGLEEELNIQ